MIRFAMIAAALGVLATPSFAANGCSAGPASNFKPQTDLQAMLTKDGMTVRNIKTENGCYEVYAVDKDGKKVNVAYNAETLAKVANPEAGEN